MRAQATVEKPMFELEAIARVRSPRSGLDDDNWGAVVSRVELVEGLNAEALLGLEDFSHAEILFLFDRVMDAAIVRGARHPRGNAEWPKVGIFAQRGKDRPNRLGSTIVEVLGRECRVLVVRGLDAIDGTPVLDIKPVMAEFLPRSALRQPAWSRELMREYWAIP
jgi:tRNA-Thr(GGU) m(6)t(6)A37 methyltransferase TsaA